MRRATKESFLIFDKNFYNQLDGVVMRATKEPLFIFDKIFINN